MERGGTSNAYDWANAASLKRLQTVWIQLHDSLQKAQWWGQ